MGSILGKTEPSMKIVMLGLDAAGKTMILYKASGQEVKTTIPTIGMNVETTSWSGNLVTVWDVGGRSPLRALYRHFLEGVKGFVFVIDSADRDRMDQAKDELHRMLQMMEDVCGKVPLLVFANKQDVPAAMTAAEVASSLGLHSLPHRSWFLQPCCAVMGDGLDHGFEWLLRSARDPRALTAAKTAEGPIDAWPRAPAAAKSEARTLQRFAPIQNGTQCPFAKRARLWAAHIEDEGIIRDLQDFVRLSEEDAKLDGFVVELTRDVTFPAFMDSVRRALTKLSDADPAGEGMMRKKYIGEVGWHFRFAGAPFFVTTFSPLYPPSSPRYAFGAGAAFALLQPERSFIRHKLPLDDGTAPGVRAVVRAAFAEKGRAFVPPAPRSANAHQVVRPLREDEGFVPWWQDSESLTDASTGSGQTADSEIDVSSGD
jgi:small GTP-binding protein